MDKLMDNRWFMKGIALLLAILLYSSVPHAGGGKLNEVNVPGNQTTETIKDVPVKTYYDIDNLIVTGVPETVDLVVTGPKSHVKNAKTLMNFEVYVDLGDAEIGSRTVKLKIKDLSDKLEPELNPSTVNVNIQERITKEFRIEAEYNAALVEEGYGAGKPEIEPNKVKITGAKDVIDKITYVKATVDIKNPVNETTTRDATIRVLDRDLNKLDVLVEPETVTVTIPIKSLSKTVPISVLQKGNLPEGVTLESVETDTKEALITGEEDVLKGTESVRVEVDLSKITGNTTLTLPVIIPDRITHVSPELIKVNVKVKVDDQKKLSSLPLTMEGLSDRYKATFNDPAGGSIDLQIYGPSERIKSVGPKDFRLSVELSNLTEGEHDVKIQVDGPDNLTWKMGKETAKITITNSEV